MGVLGKKVSILAECIEVKRKGGIKVSGVVLWNDLWMAHTSYIS